MRWALLLPLAVFFVPLSVGLADPTVNQSLLPKKITQTQCSLSVQLDALRRGLLRGSPALRKLLRKQLRELAPAIPEAELRAALDREHDPALIEELSGALAARMARLNQPDALRAPLSRAQNDPNPEARAAALRGLRGTASVEAMNTLGQVSYDRLIRDPSPAVREAVVSNLLAENAEIYFGHDRAVSEKAIAVALAARSGPAADPAQAARLLSEISTEAVGHDSVTALLSLLSGPLDPADAGLRAAAVTALSGVPGTEAATVASRLAEHYRKDSAPEVRTAILEALVRLLLTAAPSQLEALRGVDAGQDGEIDAWLRALRSGFQEWSLIKREKLGGKASLPGSSKTAAP